MTRPIKFRAWDDNNLFWRAFFSDDAGHHLTQSESTAIEVIGNIYSNPELLNG